MGMRVGFAQVNSTVGDLAGNRDRILSAYEALCQQGADLVLTPELAVTGYPPMDLLFKSRFVPSAVHIVDELEGRVGVVPLVVGSVSKNISGVGQPFRNSAFFLRQGDLRLEIHKTLLPTYDVFDEARYFEPGTATAPVAWKGRKLGVTICEDVWTEKYLGRRFYGRDPVAELVEDGADMILNLSASPYHLGKGKLRREMLLELAARHGVPFAYCNAVGGNDQLIFDGCSIASQPDGRAKALPSFTEAREVIDFDGAWADDAAALGDCEELHKALVLGIRDYFSKCGFRDAVLGLSGGIDSAVCACLAVEALGAGHVTGVAMPSEYSSPGSIADAKQLAGELGIRLLVLPIQKAFEVMRTSLSDVFAGYPPDTTEENLQSRLRGMTLMALSNKFGSLLITTGNTVSYTHLRAHET
jgi:predicted amidohydrolase